MRDMWQDRWREGRIGFHEREGSALLRRHWRGQAAGCSVLVPLCGKSVDMLWLADQGLRVTGVELSAIAVEAFFDENGLEYSVQDLRDQSGLARYRSESADIEIYCGDYFAFAAGAPDAAPFDALYDRGALVALPAAERPAYARHTEALLLDDAFRMVITLEYDDDKVSGPPFSVGAAELLGYWPDLGCVATRNDIETGSPKFRNAGLKEVIESVWISG